MTVAPRIAGWHVLAGFAVFFGIVFAANGLFVYYALATHPGNDVRDAYVGGLEFNRELAQKRAQEKLGWQATIEATPLGAGQVVELSFVDSNGNPIEDLTLIAELRNPVVAARDRTIAFERVGIGKFRAKIDVPRAAQRDLIVEARSKQGDVFRLSHRL
ncbi:MAG: FixH family protein [Alphaproteobacteria bacterium]